MGKIFGQPAQVTITWEVYMPAFRWNNSFLTDLPAVDEQHRHLVDLINTLGEHLELDEVKAQELDKLFRELVEYADYHFSEEEAMMRTVGLDPRHTEGHVKAHRRFLEDLELHKTSGNAQIGETASRILDYLVHWLSYHILGQDQNMARQIEAVRAGMDAGAAFEAGEREQHTAIEPLIEALNGLLAQLSARNRELLELNRSLEQRVAERTRALSEANHRLQALSLEDSLTGLSNRRHAMMQLETLWSESRKQNRPLAALMIDADYFKSVNDTHGHDAGDAVLIELARALEHAVRTDDLVFRLGGDEFLVLCPNTDRDGAMKVARHIESRVAELLVPVGDSAWSGSISIGVAARQPQTHAFEELIKQADDALYQAKAGGRGCIRFAV